MMLSWAFLILLWGKPYLALSFVLIAIMGYPAKLLHERRLSGKGLILYLGVILLWVMLAPYWFRELGLSTNAEV
jgi:hypothetical protein